MARKPAKKEDTPKSELDEFLDEETGADDELEAAEQEGKDDAEDATDGAGESEPADEPEAGKGAEPQDEGEAEKPADRRTKQVPLQALDEERHKRKELQQQLDDARGQIDQLRATFQRSVENFAERLRAPAPQAEKPTPPDPDDDPFGNLDHRLRGLESDRPDPRAIEQQQLVNNVVTTAQAQFESFKAGHPELDPAYQFLRQSRLNEFRTMGMDDASAAQQLTNDEWAVALNSLKAGKNVGQAIIDLATARGFQADQSGRQEQESGGKESQAREASEKLRKAEQASREATGARSGGDTLNDAPLGLEELAQLEGDAFDRAFEKMINRELRRERRGQIDDDLF